MFGKVAAIAEITSLANGENLYTAYPALRGSGNHVDAVGGVAVHVLLVLNAAQVGDLIAVPGGILIVQIPGGAFHTVDQFIGHGSAFAFQEHLRMAYILGIILLADQPDTGGGTAFDLVLQTGT